MPPEPRATVTPLATTWPAMKLTVELVGAGVALGPMKTAQAKVWSVTVRLPVTAGGIGRDAAPSGDREGPRHPGSELAR